MSAARHEIIARRKVDGGAIGQEAHGMEQAVVHRHLHARGGHHGRVSKTLNDGRMVGF